MFPLHLALSPEQTLFYETSRKLLEAESPLTTVRSLVDDPLGFDRDLWRRQAALGWFGLLVPEAKGGGSLAGAGVVDATMVASELGRLVQPGPVLPTGLVAGALAAEAGTRHADTLAGLIDGELTATWCAPTAGQLWRGQASVEVRRAASGYTLDGTAAYVQDAQAADVLLVTGRLDGGLCQLLVAASTPGVRIEPLESLDLARRLADVHFEGAVVPEGSLVGESASAPGTLERQLEVAVVLQTAETVGAIDRVYEFTLDYAKDRMAFGRPIGSYQAIKHRLADMLATLESCKATALAAAEAVDTGDQAAAELVSVAKVFVGRAAPILVQECVQIHGGIGVTWEHDLHLYLRRVATNAALYGTPTDHSHRLAGLLEGEPSDG